MASHNNKKKFLETNMRQLLYDLALITWFIAKHLALFVNHALKWSVLIRSQQHTMVATSGMNEATQGASGSVSVKENTTASWWPLQVLFSWRLETIHESWLSCFMIKFGIL